MKRLRAILKDLQDSGQQASIVGHFTIQVGNLHKVTNANDVRDQPKITPLVTDDNQNPNRYITEQAQNRAEENGRVCSAVALPPELLNVIEIWPSLPLPVRAGILAMIQAASFSGNAQL